MSNLLPPEYVNVPVELLYKVDLPASVRLTAIRIYGLGWRHRYERTDSVTLDELMEICDVGRSTLYGHLATLSDKRVLRYTTVTVGRERTFVFELLITGETLKRAPPGASPEIWTDSAIHDVDASSISDRCREHHERQQQQATHVVEGGCGGKQQLSRNLDERSGILDAMGVAEPTRSRILGLEQATEEYLRMWADWFEGQDKLGVGWLVMQIREGIEPPATRAESKAAERQRYLEWGG